MDGLVLPLPPRPPLLQPHLDDDHHHQRTRICNKLSRVQTVVAPSVSDSAGVVFE